MYAQDHSNTNESVLILNGLNTNLPNPPNGEPSDPQNRNDMGTCRAPNVNEDAPETRREERSSKTCRR